MRRAFGPLVTPLALVAAGCAAARGGAATASDAGGRAAGRADAQDACHAAADPVVETSAIVPSVEPPWGAKISRVDMVGASHVPRDLLLSTIHLTQSSILESGAVTRDVRALLALEAIEAVRVDVERTVGSDSVLLRYVIQERRVVGKVSYRWPRPLLAGHWVPLASGELYDPARVARTRSDLETNLVDEGYVQARVEARHRANGPGPVDVCFLVDTGPRFVIDRISFSGNERASQAELAELVESHGDRANRAGRPYREDLLELDLIRVYAHYYDRGHLSVRVGPARTVTTLDAAASTGHITVEIPIEEGPVFRIRRVRFAGVGVTLVTRAEYLKRLGVKPGEVFDRTKIATRVEDIRELHRRRGEAVEITPETKLDPARGEVDLVIEVKRAGKPAPPPPKASR